MNYSFMTFSTPELTLAENLAVAQKYGYQGIEPRIVAGHKHGIELDATAETRRDARKQAADAGIALCCLATSCTYANPETHAQNVDITLQAIDLAGDVGAPRIRVFGGGFPETVSREGAIQLLVDGLSIVAAQAEARGVIVSLETHDSWCDPRHIAAVLSQINHPNIGANWDIMHPVRAGGTSIVDSFAILKPWIAHLHVHDGVMGEPFSLLPIGEGAIDHRAALKCLKSTNYTGFISGEWIGWEPYEIHLPRELAKLREYEVEVS